MTEVRIHNGSVAPIFEVAVLAFDCGDRRFTWRLRRIEKWWTGQRVGGGERHFNAILAGTTTTSEHLPGLWGINPTPSLPGRQSC